MQLLRSCLLLALVASASAFSAPTLPLRASGRAAVSQRTVMSYSPVPSPEGTKETYWETKAPSSEVLGIGKNLPSGSFASASVVAALVGGFCTSQCVPLTADPNPLYIAGSLFLPYSWALHVAAWIQKNNGK
ncbi:hypothetical protein GUITHDRAFT_96294 [Guillardia theta CCMP2712]|uniref:Uncharacterized protein n=1 Tax=Guillardia theta (strain CCMP2712) TaxID=905079 RepID=L1IWX4_GUITC|nr:hypothetical protein GUITHDRAFT_96294 [Guillardia theta CCMP2712]EKX40617.1 hypothetical protein GUITHDRAFT_96294 [Guillardia theta CCMP2712]|eukprot:XP_005827597.1 hypothetical protein GUITHDRAFT_96294 [Guillardia theta CCMP2712]